MDNTRTLQQNRALHLMFDQLAQELNHAGLDMRRTLKPSIDIPWTGETVKEHLWRPIQEAQVGKRSTTELTTKEIDAIFLTINRHLGERFGIVISFPSIDSLIYKNEEGV